MREEREGLPADLRLTPRGRECRGHPRAGRGRWGGRTQRPGSRGDGGGRHETVVASLGPASRVFLSDLHGQEVGQGERTWENRAHAGAGRGGVRCMGRGERVV